MWGGGIIAGLAAATAAVTTQFVIPPPAPPPLPIPDEAALDLGNAQARMTVPVTIGERGPWNFIIDTGAERTVVSRELAGVLGLAAGPQVRVIAMTGATPVGTVIVPRLSVSTISQSTIAAPALESRNLGAQGMLGVDSLQGHAVAIDFDKQRMTLRPSKKRVTTRSADPNEIVIVAKSVFGQLIVTDARCQGEKVAVIVDTGSPISIGNPALLAALKKPPRDIGEVTVTSATGDILQARTYAVDNVALGGMRFNDVPIAIADGAPFHRFGLADRPAMLLGMDALRLFRTVSIDFPNREIRFSLPRRIATPAINGV